MVQTLLKLFMNRKVVQKAKYTRAHYEVQQNVTICFQMLVKKEGVFIDIN
jgi:hypothetical protein